MNPSSRGDEAGVRPSGAPFRDERPGTRSRAFALAAFCLAAIAVYAMFRRGEFAQLEARAASYRPGVAAEFDLVAERDIVIEDRAATAEARRLAMSRVPAVFRLDAKAAARALSRFDAFDAEFVRLSDAEPDDAVLAEDLAAAFADAVDRPVIERLAAHPAPKRLFLRAREALAAAFARGVFALPAEGLAGHDPDVFELRADASGRVERRPTDGAQTERAALKRAGRELAAILPDGADLALALVEGFIEPNVAFDADESRRLLRAAARSVETVKLRIAKGDLLAEKGKVVSDADYADIVAAREYARRFDVSSAAGGAAFLALVILAACKALSERVSGVRLGPGQLHFVLGAALAVFAAVTSVGPAFRAATGLSPDLVVPTALVATLVAVLLSTRFASIYILFLSVAGAVASSWDAAVFLRLLFAGFAGAFAAEGAEKRFDLVRAAVFMAIVQAAAAVTLGLAWRQDVALLAAEAFWSAFNGLMCGMLAIGVMPLVEQALNAPTRFRLLELSDLNAPLLKRLFAVAPGTYGHSIAVAHLAESACRGIGANPLLARVGAYYHDIGKIEQPEYFIENQSGRNKHDDLNPRLSATVLRSHVKLGAEKARALGLPDAVVDIVAQHHGNGLIAWFYEKALKREESVSVEDFSYPGQPPSSREAAVVMLADAVEAGSRTLKRPTVGRLDQFVHGIIMERFAKGQLARSELTFRDFEIVKNSFVRILAAHYHSRIEYPKAKERTT